MIFSFHLKFYHRFVIFQYKLIEKYMSKKHSYSKMINIQNEFNVYIFWRLMLFNDNTLRQMKEVFPLFYMFLTIHVISDTKSTYPPKKFLIKWLPSLDYVSIAKRNKLLGFSIVDKRIIKMFDIFIEQNKQTRM